MKLQIADGEISYEIELNPLTQLCGMNLPKKKYILTSLHKHFSSAKYLDYEKNYVQNVQMEDKDVGRKYFKTYYLKEREDYINGIKLGKTSLMMQYLSDRIQEFHYQKSLEEIGEQLQRIFLALNEEVFASVGNLEFRYEEKDLFSMVQSTEICGRDEKPLEMTDLWELLQMYLNVFLEVYQNKPEKTLIIIENIDHLLTEKEYLELCKWIEEIVQKYDIWFLLTTSLPGFVYLSEESMSGLNIVNDLIYPMPSCEKIVEFLQNNYPCSYAGEEWREELKSIIHYIGKEGVTLYPAGMVMLKLMNQTMCVETNVKRGLNQVENSFLIS